MTQERIDAIQDYAAQQERERCAKALEAEVHAKCFCGRCMILREAAATIRRLGR